MADTDKKALEAQIRSAMVEDLVIDLAEWAMKRDPEFRTKIEADLRGMKDEAEAELATIPTPEAEANRKIAILFLGIFGMKGG